jgi:hypothetical protein
MLVTSLMYGAMYIGLIVHVLVYFSNFDAVCTMSKSKINGNKVIDILSTSIILWFLVPQVVLQCNFLGDS